MSARNIPRFSEGNPISPPVSRFISGWRRRRKTWPIGYLTLTGVLFLAACGPNYNAIANRLRETTLQQRDQITKLNEQLANRDASIRDLKARLNGERPSLQTLPPARHAQLFTASRLEIRSTTDAAELTANSGINGFRVFIRTYTDDGQVIPATGALTIEAFELPLAPAPPRRLGHWVFTPEEMKKNWFSGFGLNQFGFSCPWQSPPTISNINFKAKLEDALTGQTLETEISKPIHFTPKK